MGPPPPTPAGPRENTFNFLYEPCIWIIWIIWFLDFVVFMELEMVKNVKGF